MITPVRRRKEHISPTPIHAIADKLAPEVRARFLLAVEQLRGRVNLADVTHYVEQRDADGVIATIRLSQFPHDLQPLIGTLRQIFQQAGTVAAEQLTVSLNVAIRFDEANPLAVAWARHYSAALVTELTDTTRAAVRSIVAEAVQAGQAPAVTARTIRSLIGLTERQALAVLKYEAELVADQRAAEVVAAMRDRYAAQLLTYRARVIARTETIKASAQGQLNLWKQAAQNGVLNPAKTQRVWVVTDDDRLDEAICAPMAEQAVDFNENFTTPDGDSIDSPPAHPGCRCAVVLNV
jgi:hypothetical protein